jgi:enoyl-CoA hydratase/carnithine racemase
MEERLLIDRRDGAIGRMTLNDPARANVLSSAMIEALIDAVSRAGDDDAIRVIVLDAVGAVFCAGHDLTELRADEDAGRLEALFRRCADMMAAISASPKPVIAKVSGAAVAAGCQLVASCDLAYAERGARFAVSGIDLGLFCSTPSVPLSRKVGHGAALEMLLTGRFIGAEEAAAIGLINRVSEGGGQLQAMVEEAAASIASKAPQAVALGKALFRAQLEQPVAQAYDLAVRAMVENLGQPCAQAGIDGFIAARAARAKSAR